MTTQVTTKPVQAITAEGERAFTCRGGGPLGEDSENHGWFGGPENPFNAPGRGSGRGGSGGGGGEGNGGGRGGGNPDDQNHAPKLSGKEPIIFDGDHSKSRSICP